MEELTKQGVMKESGLKAFEHRKEHRSRIYAYENKEPSQLSDVYENKFKANKKAWNFFITQAPSYKKVIIHRIMTAKQEKTQVARLVQAISESEKQKRLF
jgi:uncharacterized protein YdeI (YjbR/CyaY-like superfamily)